MQISQLSRHLIHFDIKPSSLLMYELVPAHWFHWRKGSVQGYHQAQALPNTHMNDTNTDTSTNSCTYFDFPNPFFGFGFGLVPSVGF